MLDKYRNKYSKYVNFIKKYRSSLNAATGSEVDSNANVENKNVATCTGEIPKKDFIGINRLLMIEKLTELFGEDVAIEYIRQLDSHEIYKHDETNPLLPYCVSITMYPFLFEGLRNIGGTSEAPHNLDSFCGAFCNLVFAVASQFAGAVATPEFFMYMDYFIRREYGDDYYLHPEEVVTRIGRIRTIGSIIEDKFSQVIYTINQPAGTRNYQSVFWNVAFFDRPYFWGMFEDFVFPDLTTPIWESVSWLQKRFMKWFNKERTKQILTFPVETMNLLNDGKHAVDAEWRDFAAEMWAEGHSFFCYTSDTVDSLASCCRLKSEVQNNTFSYTLGAGGIATGSKCVITMNLNRLVQNIHGPEGPKPTFEEISEMVAEQARKIHKYLKAYNEIIKDNFKANMLPVYKAGYISLEKQYLTLGIQGGLEAAEFLGIEPTVNDKYFKYFEHVLKPIHDINKEERTSELMFNTEFVPAENLGVKNAKWDKEDGYVVPRDCYNSYFYRVEDKTVNIIDKFILHGNRLTKYLDGRQNCLLYLYRLSTGCI